MADGNGPTGRTYSLGPDATLFYTDCRDALRALPAECVDSVVTDPPYHLTSIVKRFGGANAAPAQFGTDGAYKRASTGFMGKQWDGGDIAFDPAFWAEVYRVLKPGGHVVAFGASRGYHRMACAIEDAGFEIRDSLMWVYASGFPKSHDVSKGIDKAAGAKREKIGERRAGIKPNGGLCEGGLNEADKMLPITAPATPEAVQWEGWGTALKPAFEPILLCSKPLTVAQHVAICVEGVTCQILELLEWCDSSVSGAEKSFSDIRAKCDAVASSVAANAKIRSLASIGIASFADQTSTLLARESNAPIRTRGCFVLSHVKPNGSEDKTAEQVIPRGQAEDISTRLLDMSMSVTMGDISENIALLWNDISVALLDGANTFTIETASKLTIALKTLNLSMQQHISIDTGNLSPDALPIVLARKPLSEGTVAANVLKWGTGALNIDGCRVEASDGANRARPPRTSNEILGGGKGTNLTASPHNDAGRWPANVVHDGSEEVVGAFPTQKSGAWNGKRNSSKTKNTFGEFESRDETPREASEGSAARFFYSAKASKADRAGSKHPTVKPISLMRWLARLVTPPGGVVLDPFAGSGTTGAACAAEGFRCILIEREAEYVGDVLRRFESC